MDGTQIPLHIAFVTNMCTHYVIRLFEILSQRYSIDFYFTGGFENYWEKKNKAWLGNFNGVYLKGFLLAPKLKFTPGLFRLGFMKSYTIFIKTLDDRFALFFIFSLAKIFRKPFVLWTGIWSHPLTFFHQLTFKITKGIYQHSEAIIVYGEHVKRYLIGLGISEEKIFCAPHAVDNRDFNQDVPADEKRELKKQLGAEGRKIILYVGRLETCKGLDYLVEAASQLEDEKPFVLFIGTGTQKDRLEEKCKAAKFPYAFLKHILNNELYRYYAIGDIFVLPSITTKDFKEPWGLVINEAMNQGCPVITTDAVGAAQGGLVQDGKNGFIVPEKDTNALKGAIAKLLKDESHRRQMAQSAREDIQSWTPEHMSSGFEQAIDFVQQRYAL